MPDILVRASFFTFIKKITFYKGEGQALSRRQSFPVDDGTGSLMRRHDQHLCYLDVLGHGGGEIHHLGYIVPRERAYTPIDLVRSLTVAPVAHDGKTRRTSDFPCAGQDA